MDVMDDEELFIIQYLYRMAVAKIFFTIIFVLVMSRRLKRKRLEFSREIMDKREMIRESMLRGLSNDITCRNTCRMGTTAFLQLCNILRRDGGLQPTQHASIEKQVAMFFMILGPRNKNLMT
jgi:hypothetical protein